MFINVLDLELWDIRTEASGSIIAKVVDSLLFLNALSHRGGGVLEAEKKNYKIVFGVLTSYLRAGKRGNGPDRS